MKRNKFLMMAAILLIGLFTGCSTTKVKRVDVEKPIDLSGRWNDTDSQLVSEEMMTDCLKRLWVNEFNEKYKRTPVVIVGTINNRSHEHIDAQIFTKDLEKNLLNSRQVKFVASPQERVQVRDERQEQQRGWTDPETIKKIGKETGADFMLIGSINSVKDEIKSRYVILYEVNLELVDLETNQKVWIGQKDIKKIVTKSKFSL